MPDTHSVACWKYITAKVAETLTGWTVRRVYSLDNLKLEDIKEAAQPIALIQLASYAELPRTTKGKDVEVNMQFDVQLAGNLTTDLTAEMDEYLAAVDTLKKAFWYCPLTMESGEVLQVKNVECSNDALYDERAYMTNRIFLNVSCITVRAYITM